MTDDGGGDARAPATVDLDDEPALRAADPSGMLPAIGRLGDQLRHGYAAGREASGLPQGVGVRAVVFCGMGGSGIAGDVAWALYAPRLSIPLVVVKGYELPEFAGRETLVFAVSFSGNTEETLAAYDEATQRGCRLVAVAAGGELAERAERDGVAVVPIPTDAPKPRAAIGYQAAAPIGVLERMGLVPHAADEVAEAAEVLDAGAATLGPASPTSENLAKRVARAVGERFPVVWGSEGLAWVAACRWRTDFHENAKWPAFASLLPELDHNEIVGWGSGGGAGRFLAIVLRHAGEHHRNADRVEATLRALGPVAGLAFEQVSASGAAPLARLFSLVQAGDYASTYHALARGVDPTPIAVLDDLKSAMAEAG